MIGSDDADGLFEQAWSGRLFGHAVLLAAARHRASGNSSGLQSGGTCPLCGFSAWDVAALADAASVATAIRADFPAWLPDHHRVAGRSARFMNHGDFIVSKPLVKTLISQRESFEVSRNAGSIAAE